LFDLVVSGGLMLSDRVHAGGRLAASERAIRAVGAGAPRAARTSVEADGTFVFPGVAGQVHAGSTVEIEGLGDR